MPFQEAKALLDVGYTTWRKYHRPSPGWLGTPRPPPQAGSAEAARLPPPSQLG